MDYKTSLLMTEFVTHDVKRFIVSKPQGFSFKPGQGVELVINEPRWQEEEGRPFTPTSLPGDRVLEFTIKRYAEHQGVTDKLHSLTSGAELLISKPFGTIRYKGPGVFIAAGAGVTPFLSILRNIALQGSLDNHLLIFSNKTAADIICEKELRHYLGRNCYFTLTREKMQGYGHGRISENRILETIKEIDRYFYVCGPEEFVQDMNIILKKIGAKPELLVFEE